MKSLNFEISYSTDQHKRILEAIRNRRKMSEREMSKRHEKWREADEKAIGYVKETDNDALRKAHRKNSGVHDYVTIEVPYSYGMMMTAHTYWTSVFLGRNPVLQFMGRHGESEQKVQAVEALMGYQTEIGSHMVPLYIWIYDAAKYGLGIVGSYWDEEMRTVARIEEVPETFLGMPVPGKFKKTRIVESLPGYRGNKLFNIRPFDWFPDPRVPLYRFQEGEFCGRRVEVSWLDILGQRDDYFNLGVLEQMKKSRGSTADKYESTSRVDYPNADGDDYVHADFTDTSYVELLEMCIRIVPKDWGLGESIYPEKWVFTVGNDQVIIGARPLGNIHDKFPYDVLEQEIDGYAMFKRGVMEQNEELNNVMTWLINSHFYNVRAALNNNYVYDPSRIVMKDLMDPQPGKMIRLKPEAYGTDTRTAVTQLQTMDITRAHMEDMLMVGNLMQRASGIVDNVMGMVNTGGRKTATEIRTSSTFSVNRLKTVAEYMSAMGFAPLAQKLLQNTQQFYDAETRMRIVGDIGTGDPFVTVTPDMISGFYDYVPVDGTLPVDRFAQANLWKEIMINMRNMPEIAQGYDLTSMFAWVAQLAGMRNIKQFRVKMVPDKAIANAVQAGNLAPMIPSQASLKPNLQEPRQLPNMGPTG